MTVMVMATVITKMAKDQTYSLPILQSGQIKMAMAMAIIATLFPMTELNGMIAMGMVMAITNMEH